MSCHSKSFSLKLFDDSSTFDFKCSSLGLAEGISAVASSMALNSGDDAVVEDCENEGGENELADGVDWSVQQFVLLSSTNMVFS